jgi:hypothetical protein
MSAARLKRDAATAAAFLVALALSGAAIYWTL